MIEANIAFVIFGFGFNGTACLVIVNSLTQMDVNAWSSLMDWRKLEDA
jgi:hypothetical protein